MYKNLKIKTNHSILLPLTWIFLDFFHWNFSSILSEFNKYWDIGINSWVKKSKKRSKFDCFKFLIDNFLSNQIVNWFVFLPSPIPLFSKLTILKFMIFEIQRKWNLESLPYLYQELGTSSRTLWRLNYRCIFWLVLSWCIASWCE